MGIGGERGGSVAAHPSLPCGPAIGRVLEQLLDAVIESQALNDHDQLMTLAREMA